MRKSPLLTDFVRSPEQKKLEMSLETEGTLGKVTGEAEGGQRDILYALCQLPNFVLEMTGLVDR